MKSWDRLLFSSFNYTKLKPKLINYFILLKKKTTNNSTTTTTNNISRNSKLIVAASTSLISSFAYFYYAYLNSNESKSLALTAKSANHEQHHQNHNQFIDEYNDYENTIIRNYKRKKECNRLIKRYKEEYGVPGIIVGVSKNGKIIYSKGFGYSDVENNVHANPHTVVRIASISKPITCTLAAQLFQSGKLDLDKPIDYYLNDLPEFKWQNRNFKITARQLMCHVSGIRHYEKFNNTQKQQQQQPNHDNNTNDIDDVGNDKSYKRLYPVKAVDTGDSLFSEFFFNKPFKTTREALEIFIHDDLMFEPGKGYLYSTYGYTLLSAVLEKCNGKNSKFSDMLIDLFKKLDMNETYLDYNSPLITYRSKYYLRNDKKALVNVPYVDNSYKWAGGGILSTVGDLIKYGNHLLKSYQQIDETNSNTYLKSSTVKSYVWSPQSQPPKDDLPYGLGWHLNIDKNKKIKYVYHTGGAVGSTTCLLIIPTDSNGNEINGLVVSILCNLQDIREIVKLSLQISDIFMDRDD